MNAAATQLAQRVHAQPAPALFRTGVAIVGLAVFLALFGTEIAPYEPTVTTGAISVPPPPLTDWLGLLWATFSGQIDKPVHWFGTDTAGLDVFSRTIAAPRADLLIALSATSLSFLVGIVLGALAGFFRNWATETLMRVSDLLQSFPVFISAMVLVALAGRSELNLVLAMTLLYTPIFTRLTRAEVLTQKNNGYVDASRALGVSELAIAFQHVLPNSLRPAIVQISVTIGFAILLTAGLSFVGAGLRPPQPEWGLMIATGASQILLGNWWAAVFPGIAVSLTVFGFAALGQALERRFDD